MLIKLMMFSFLSQLETDMREVGDIHILSLTFKKDLTNLILKHIRSQLIKRWIAVSIHD